MNRLNNENTNILESTIWWDLSESYKQSMNDWWVEALAARPKHERIAITREIMLCAEEFLTDE